MGFISFSENYYSKKLEEYENRPLSYADLYEAKQLLKVLYDLADEGYTELNEEMEADFSCLTRLRAVIQEYGSSPFLLDHDRLSDTSYCAKEYELEELLGELAAEASKQSNASSNPFLSEIRRYSEWVGYDEDTAYIFLLRDALLPYIFFLSRNRNNIYPWLISRKFLEDITKIENADDIFRLPLCESLESGNVEFEDFFTCSREGILSALEAYPELKAILLELFGSIKKKRILVIESGYMGTMTMLLKAFDDRVDFRLYTTAPFLYKTYRDKIFCCKYEDMRKFETFYSHDLLLQYSSFRNGKFYVKLTDECDVMDKSLSEMNPFINCSGQKTT